MPKGYKTLGKEPKCVLFLHNAYTQTDYRVPPNEKAIDTIPLIDFTYSNV